MTTGYLLLCTPTQQQRLLWGTQGGVSEGAFLWRGGCHHDIIWPLASPPPHTSSSLLLGRVATASLSGLETLLESSVRSYLVGNAGSRPISEAKQPWACLVLRWGTTGEAHVLYSLSSFGREAVEAGLAFRDLAAAAHSAAGAVLVPAYIQSIIIICWTPVSLLFWVVVRLSLRSIDIITAE
jgi:hypothetical protein